jgi:prepilin-type N-terminal cleavage/methylation domain-containing protein
MLSRRRGLTLVEVLAVVAIIGLLAGLLLPAVQSVRESARRSSCGNNMRQMATAIESYTNQNGFLRPGGVGRPWRPGTTGGEGFRSLFPSVFQCPSNPVPVRKTTGFGPGLRPAYVGISGADVDPGYRGSFDQGHTASCGPGTWQNNLRAIQTYAFGLVSINGILIPNGRLTPGHVLDGMSNTMVVGEQSDWGISLGGGTVGTISWAAGSQIPCRAGQGWVGGGRRGHSASAPSTRSQTHTSPT